MKDGENNNENQGDGNDGLKAYPIMTAGSVWRSTTTMSCSAWHSTTAMCSWLLRKVYDTGSAPFISTAATLGMLPILSRQLSTIEEYKLSPLGPHSSNLLYLPILIDFALFNSFLTYNHLTMALNFHLNSKNPEFGHDKKLISLLFGLFVSIPIFLTFQPDDSTPLYASLFTIATTPPALKFVSNYLCAVVKHSKRQNLELESNQLGQTLISNDVVVTWKEVLLKSIITISVTTMVTFMFFGIEFNNQKFAESKGFDIYDAWLITYGFPLVVATVIQGNYLALGTNTHLIPDIIHDTSCLKKFSLGVISIPVSFGRGLAFTSFADAFFKEILPEENSIIASVILGGLICNVMDHLVDINHLRAIISNVCSSNIHCTDALLVLFSLIQGVVLATPITVEAFTFINSKSFGNTPDDLLISSLLKICGAAFSIEKAICFADYLYKAFHNKPVYTQGSGRIELVGLDGLENDEEGGATVSDWVAELRGRNAGGGGGGGAPATERQPNIPLYDSSDEDNSAHGITVAGATTDSVDVL